LNHDRFIKKHIIGKPQTFLLKCPSGFRDEILVSVREFISHFSNAQSIQIDSHERGLKVSGLKIRQVLDLIFTLPLFTDVLVLLESKKVAHESDLSGIDFKLLSAYLSCGSSFGLLLRNYNSIKRIDFSAKLASRLTIEGLSFTSGEQTTDTYIESYFSNSRHNLYVSLTGSGLYKRGVKKYLYGEAPLREDYAACLLMRSLKNLDRRKCINVYVPFAGSGTLGFETLGLAQGRVIHNAEGWYISRDAFGLNKSINNLSSQKMSSLSFQLKNLIFVEKDQKTFEVLSENLKQPIWGTESEGVTSCFEGDAFDPAYTDILMDPSASSDTSDVFLPLNPPWGKRLGEEGSSDLLYRKSLDLILELSKVRGVFGFIICGSDSQWSLVSNTLSKFNFEIETLNYTQGGLHIRSVYFKKASL
jgi:23S rRNA G2445 N2-methylase RlmL